jgi:hypothetical protein
MKTVLKSPKNIREITLFFRVFNFVRKVMPEAQYLSGFPSYRSREIQSERAVNMTEFLQLKGVPL